MKRGFTLVELSIVLVIIGLLIGGILAAQSMIVTAKTQGFVRQIQQYDAAVSNFKVKYKALPGDAKAFGGDGNGRITPSDSPSFGKFDSEVANFWPNLQASGLSVGANLTATISSTFSITPPNQNSPVVVLTRKAGIVVLASGTAPIQHFYSVGDFSRTDLSGVRWDDSITPEEALAVDTKIDDGLPTFSVNTIINDGLSGGGGGPSNGPCSSGGKYKTDNKAFSCTLAIRIADLDS